MEMDPPSTADIASIAAKKKFEKFECPICNKLLSSKERVESHIKCVHMKAKHHVCEKCGSAYALVRDLEKHIKFVHERVRDQICDLCGYRTYNTQELGVHKKRVHEKRDKVKRFECPHCEYKAFLKKTRDNHVKIMHIRIKDVQCPLCEYANYTRLSVNKHLIDTHLNFLGTHKCLECDHVAENKHQLKRHVRWEHHGGKREECPKCSFVATKTLKLWPHWRTHHPNDEVLHCDMCGYITPLEYLMERHKTNIHSKTKIACPICGFETNAVNQLTKHIWLAHDKWNPHKCPYCTFKCGTEAQLLSHIDAEHDEKAMAEEYEVAEAALKQFQREHWRYRRGSYKRKTNDVVAGPLNGEIGSGRRRCHPRKTAALNEDEEWGEGDEVAEMKMTDERLQELGEENRRLDATIARHVYRVVKGRPSGGYAPTHKGSMKQDILITHKRGRKSYNANLFLENMTVTMMTIKELEEEKLRLDSSVVRQVQNAVRRTRPQFLNAQSMIPDHQSMDQIEVDSDGKRCNDGSKNEPVIRKKCDKRKAFFDVEIKHMWKVETVDTKQSESNTDVKKLNIFTMHVGEKKDVRECEGDKDAHNVKVLSVGRTPINQINDSLQDYLFQKRRKRKEVSISDARDALTCLNSFLCHKHLTQEISKIKNQFDNLVQEELRRRLEDENGLLDVAVAHAVERSRHGVAWGVER